VRPAARRLRPGALPVEPPRVRLTLRRAVHVGLSVAPDAARRARRGGDAGIGRTASAVRLPQSPGLPGPAEADDECRPPGVSPVAAGHRLGKQLSIHEGTYEVKPQRLKNLLRRDHPDHMEKQVILPCAVWTVDGQVPFSEVCVDIVQFKGIAARHPRRLKYVRTNVIAVTGSGDLFDYCSKQKIASVAIRPRATRRKPQAFISNHY
jgi:hypothetical protein